MSIKKQLTLLTSIVFILLLAVGSTVLFGYRYITDRASVANKLDKESMYLQMMLRGVNEVIITEGTPQSVEVAKEGAEGFGRLHTELLREAESPDMREILENTIDPRWQSIKEDLKPFLVRDLDVEAEGIMIKYGGLITETSDIIQKVKALSEKTRSVVNANSAKYSRVQSIMIIGLAAVLLLFAFLSRKTYHSITLPIAELMTIAEGFHKGDLSISMKEHTKDEFGILASHFNKATIKLSTMISKVLSSMITLASSSESLSASISQIASNNLEQSTQTSQAAAATEELNSSFQNVAQNSVIAAESAKNATELAVKGGEVVNQTISGMKMIEESVRESASSIEALGHNSEKISDIVKVINEIAGQTNLLALNAAIEAARAGEQGRGFAVVADEVRKLAEKTTAATKEIAETIDAIQSETGKAVQTMRSGNERVGRGVDLANEAGQSLQRIVSSVQNVTDMIQQIATAAEQQSSTGGEIASNLESVADLTRQTADGAQASSESTLGLNELAQQIQKLLREFKLQNERALRGVQTSSAATDLRSAGDARKIPV